MSEPVLPRPASTWTPAALLGLAALLFSGCALTVVTVGAPAVNCVFDASCTVEVTDTSAPIPLGTGGTNFLQSRTFSAASGAPAAGLRGYEYRVNLIDALGTVDIPCVRSMSIDVGSIANTLDYNGDGATGDQVWVVTAGGIGTIGLASATKFGTRVSFRFSAPVCAGGGASHGDSTFFFGLASASSPVNVNATVYEVNGTGHDVPARAPQ